MRSPCLTWKSKAGLTVRKGYICGADLKDVFELFGETVSEEELQSKLCALSVAMIKIVSQKSQERLYFRDFVDFFYKVD